MTTAIRSPRRRRLAIGSAVFAGILATSIITPQHALALTPALWDSSSGNWNDGTHWSTGPAFPNDGGGIFYDATVNGGAVTVNGNFVVTDFTLNGGTITGNNTLAATGALNFAGGSFGDGTATGSTTGPLSIDLSASGQGFILQNYTLGNSGTGTWTGSGTVYNTGTLANSGTLSIQNNQGINNNGVVGVINNTGTLVKTVATGITTIQSTFQNAGGTVDVQSGVISLDGGGSATGNAKFGGTGSGVISFDGGTFNMAGGTSFVGTGVSRVNGGTVSIDGPATATNFAVASGTMAGNGTLTVSGALNFTGGSFGDGTATGTTSGPLAIDLTFSGQGFVGQNYTLNNSGIGNWIGSGTLYNNGTLANSGTLNIQTDQPISNDGIVGSFHNTGTLIKKTATGTTTVQSTFQNTGGTVDVQSGVISLNGGGSATDNAKFGGTGSGVISFDGGTFNMAGGTSFVGTGVSRVNGGTVSVDGPATATNFAVASGFVSGNGALSVSNALNFTGGSFGDGTATGTTSGPLAIDFSTSGQGFINQNYTLNNSGTGNWIGTGTFYNNGTLANSGTLNIQTDQPIFNNGIVGSFHNTGTLIKKTATGTTTVQSTFQNTGGTVDVQSGVISLNGGGSATGNAKFGGTGSGIISFDGGTFNMDGGTNFVGTGVSRVNGGTVSIDGPATATNLTVAAGFLSGNGTLSVSNVLSFTGGSFGDGVATGTTSGPLAIDFTLSGQGFVGQNYTLTNSGTGNWTGTGTFYNNGTIANIGTLTLQNDQPIFNNGVVGSFNNTGTLIKSGTTGTTTIQSIFSNTGGTVEVRTGTLNLAGSTPNFNGTTHTLTGGTWKASGAGSTLSIDNGGGNRAINTLAGGADVTVGNTTAVFTGLAITNIGASSGLHALGGATVTTGGALTNSGTVEAATSSTVAVKNGGSAAVYTQNGGSLLLTGGAVTASAFNISAGVLQGFGTLSGGDVTASGTALLSPGNIEVNGNYSQTAGSGFLELDRLGDTPVAGLLAAQGNASFSNMTFTLGLGIGSDPLEVGDTFLVLEADSDHANGGTLTISNDTFVPDGSLAGYTFSTTQTPTTFSIEVTAVPTPEPSSCLLAALGFAGVAGFRRRSKRRSSRD